MRNEVYGLWVEGEGWIYLSLISREKAPAYQPLLFLSTDAAREFIDVYDWGNINKNFEEAEKEIRIYDEE